MQNNTQQIISYCCSAVNITTVSYWNCIHFYSCEIEFKKVHYVLFPLTHNDSLIWDIYYIKLWWNFFFLKNIKYVVFWIIYVTTFFEAVKEFHKLRFQSTAKFSDTKFLLLQHSKNWKTEQYWGSSDCGEIDLDSD